MHKKSKKKTLTFKNLFFLYSSSQESYKLLEEKDLLFFTHVTTTPRKEAHTLAVPKITPAIEINEDRVLPDKRGYAAACLSPSPSF